jgi:hypothetical protein
MKTAATLVILSAIALSSSVEAKRVYQTESQETVDTYLEGARGFYYGFNQGLYKVDKVDETCLNKDAETKIVDLFGMLATKQLDIMKMMSFFTDFMSIFGSLTACNTGAVSDIASFCFNNKVNVCTPDKITENIQKNLFLIMAKFTDISNIMIEGVPTDADDAYTFGRQAGLDMGSLIRVVIGFKN